MSPRFRQTIVVLPKMETNHGSEVTKLLQAGLPEGHSLSPPQMVKADLKAMVKDRTPSDAEALLIHNGYKVRRYLGSDHQIVFVTQDRQIPSTSSAVQVFIG